MSETFNKDNFRTICNQVASADTILESIIRRDGYPPMWSRKASFETLVHIILEQQVSLASAKAALNKLKEKLGSITPLAFLELTAEELRACYFSRQKIVYVRHLAETLLLEKKGGIILKDLPLMADEKVRQQLKMVKGIGDWTVDVYLMMVLHRCDLFPVSDIALANSIRYELNQPDLTQQQILQLSQHWRPFRTLAAFIFWHAYIVRKGNRL